MRAADRSRWATALGHARRRWQTAGAAERTAIATELDALWAELAQDGSEPAVLPGELDALPVTVGPRHAALGALLTSFGSPGAGVTPRATNAKVVPPRVSSA